MNSDFGNCLLSYHDEEWSRGVASFWCQFQQSPKYNNNIKPHLYDMQNQVQLLYPPSISYPKKIYIHTANSPEACFDKECVDTVANFDADEESEFRSFRSAGLLYDLPIDEDPTELSV